MSPVRESYLLSLEALEIATDRVRTACTGTDIKMASIEAHFALHMVYDLLEAYFQPRKIKSFVEQDKVLDTTGGHAVGALSLARSARTHDLVTFASVGGFGDLPYGMGPYGPGWLWATHSWTGEKLQNRSGWYKKRVGRRYLWVPLDEAWKWFAEHIDDEMDRVVLYRSLGIDIPAVWP